MPRIDSNSQTYQNLLEFVNLNFRYEIINKYQIIKQYNYKIEFFALDEVKDTNNSCPIIRVECLSYSFLVTGDISAETEKLFVSEYGSKLDSDVLKVSHHGSANATSQEFLNCVSPKNAVISVGNNSYGHPTEEVLFRLQVNEISVLRTDLDGNILYAVGEEVGCKSITNDFMITDFVFDIYWVVLLIEIVLVYKVVKFLMKE